MLTPSAAGMSVPQTAAKPAPNYSVSEGLGREGRVQGEEGGRQGEGSMLTPSAAGMSVPQTAAKPAPNYSVS